MDLSEYTKEVKNKILIDFKNISIDELNEGINQNESFIKFCFDNNYSVNHVVHELTV